MTGSAANRVWLLYVAPNALFSCASVQHFFNAEAALLYLVIILVCSFLVLHLFPFRAAKHVITSRFGPAYLGTLALLALFVALCLAFLVIYPIDNARKAIGKGNDVDQALTITASAILHGQYPYHTLTFAGNPISVMPGWAMLAIPFLLLFGRVAYLNMAWLAVWFLLLRKELQSGWAAAVVGGLTFAIFPLVGHVFVTGSDHFSSMVALCVVLIYVERTPVLRKHPSWCLALGVFTGVIVSSRMNVLVTVPILAGLMVRQAGWRNAILYGAATLVGFLATTLPWFLADPTGFAPLHTYNKLGQFDGSVPIVGMGVPIITGILAIALGLRLTTKGSASFALAVVLSLPIVAALALDMVRVHGIDFIPSLLLYGVMSTPFWVKAAIPALRALPAAGT